MTLQPTHPTEAEVQAAAEIANSSLREVGREPLCYPHLVDGTWFVAARGGDPVIYKALSLAAIALKRSSVPCFAHWSARAIGVCERVSSHAGVANPTIRCGAA